MNPQLVRVLAVVLGITIVGGAWYATRSGDDTKTSPRRSQPAAIPKGAIVVDVAYSPEKEIVFTKAFKDFNRTKATVKGKRVVVRGAVVSSGAAYDQLRAGKLKPVIWSPSSSLWGRLLTHEEDVSWIPSDNESFARTPLVVAMWEQQARALGWPKRALGWSDVVAAAQDPEVFVKLGHPEWGAFRLGQTNPDFSTSGFSAVVAEYYAATGKTEGLTSKDLANKSVRDKVRAIQSAIVHYGDTTLFFAEQMAKHGPAYASAVAMEETTLIDFNSRLRKGGQKLVAIYPEEGTFFSDNPLIVMNAPWVSASERAAAKQVSDFLRRSATQKKLPGFGFRPAEGGASGGLLTTKNGVDVSQPAQRMSLPSPSILSAIRAAWHEDRKPADVAIVLDTSGSMLDEQRLVQAQQGLSKFVKSFGARDRAALITFSDKPLTVTPLTVMNSEARTRMASTVNGLFADGGTAVFDATREGVELLRSSGDPKHIQAVVVLTDGIDNKSSFTADRLISEIGSGESQGVGGAQASPVRVFTIAYGSDADVDVMKRIADASGGKPYVGDPNSIDTVYTSISSFF